MAQRKTQKRAPDRPSANVRTPFVESQTEPANTAPANDGGRPAPVLAPWPHIDRFPLILGSNITFQHVASAMREALSGYRDRYVDVLSELLDGEPHGMSQLLKLVVAVAAGEFQVNPSDADDARAVKLAEEYRKQHKQIPFVTASLARLMWAVYFGITSEEILWTRGGGWDWTITGLQMVQTRRLSYPDYMRWDLWIWDGGALNPGADPVGGLRVKDFPNKFVVHYGNVRADYPTRDGVGRVLATYFALKKLILRVSASEFERFIKPWVLAYFSTGIDGHPRPALDEDKTAADNAVRALGNGYATAAVLPDSVRVELVGAVTTLNRDTLLSYLDDAISRVCNSQSYTASPGRSGARAASEVGERDEKRIHRFYANMLAETWQEHVVKPWVRLNFPGQEHLAPCITISVEDDPDPANVLEVAGAATDLGVEVDAEQIAKRTKLPIAKGDSKKLERPAPPQLDGPPGKGPPGSKPPPKGAGKKPPKAGARKPPAKDKTKQ